MSLVASLTFNEMSIPNDIRDLSIRVALLENVPGYFIIINIEINKLRVNVVKAEVQRVENISRL